MARTETMAQVDGRRIRLTNLDKVLYPATGTTKADVIGYYSQVAAMMVPHCAGRPATRKRWVNGVGTTADPGQVFFTKNLDSGTPDWVPRAELQHSDHRNTYPMVNDRATLVWMAQMAALEIHVPQWRFDSTGTPRNPDRIVFDLDPGPGVELPQVAEVARWIRLVLDGLGWDCVPVTSGSKGIHLYAALDGVHDAEQIRALARELATSLEADHPDAVTAQMAKAQRGGKVFLDWSQNHPNKTTVAPYSLRGRDRPTVAVPRTWEELDDPGLRHLELAEVLERIARSDDPMAGLERRAHGTDTFTAPEHAGSTAGSFADPLATYRSMRRPGRTPEPVPETAPAPGSERVFVIQEHHASRLHWDLRLADDGVLVSWAVPKGMPTDSARQHLAVQTEDHPIEYLTFSGTIPKGEYGAGQMTIWDTGTYEVHKWRAGAEIIVSLTGAPDGGLAGGPGQTSTFALIHTGSRAESAEEKRHWLLHLMAGPPGAKGARGSQAPTKPQRPTPEPSATPRASLVRAPAPMLATAGTAADVGPDWSLEMKWDGQRCLVEIDDGVVRLWARSGREITFSYPELADLAEAVTATHAILDGEVVALDPAGRPSFARLQPRMQASREADVRAAARRQGVHLMLFDALARESESLLDQPQHRRRQILQELVTPGPRVQVPPAFDGDLEAAMAASRNWGLEGVLAKRPDARYLPGKRSRSWIKLKHTDTLDVVVGGWRPGQGARTGRIGALLLGVPRSDGSWRYVGRVGTGFTDAETRAWVDRFAPLEVAEAPFDDVPAVDARGAHWVRPEQVAEVAFAEWSEAGRLRHPVWRGWRPDKTVADLVTEAEE
ncbi:ATP-dependent DNA ligase [Ruania halotolerans]|uniref:ATP-dependent DNA ligase n=1 Tax=Ruania halotolerans TaxID=2897773 RepID=UPI001E4B8786|nr:ATP-dependent DNA ligase [Ruania halotolerans]UFU04983.1 ATP-dependent DNA ligase [Ruania halotolerans]